MTRSFAGALALAAVLGLAAGGGAAYYRTAGVGATPPVTVVSATGSAAADAAGPGGGQLAAGPGGGSGGQGGQGFGGSSNNNGTIEKVDGTTATVKTSNGSSVDVQLAGTTVQKREKAVPADLKVGDNVFGRGEPNAQGVVMLSNLQIVPNAPGRGGAGAPDTATKPGGASGNGGGRQNGGGNPGGADGVGGNSGRGGDPGSGNSGRGANAAGANAPGGLANQRGFVVGSIARIDGKTLTITPPSGNAISATLADDAQIERIAPAQPADLKTGQTVALQRPPGGSGATVLTIVSG